MRTAIAKSVALRRASGFSMVETLVALVVLAVGLIGMASLFATSVRSGGSAIARMQAVALANDLADKIRANPTAGAAYAGSAANGTCATKAFGAISCNPATMAADDLYTWQAQIASTLPGSPTGSVIAVQDVSTAFYTYTITVSWNDAGTKGSASASSYTLTMQQ